MFKGNEEDVYYLKLNTLKKKEKTSCDPEKQIQLIPLLLVILIIEEKWLKKIILKINLLIIP